MRLQPGVGTNRRHTVSERTVPPETRSLNLPAIVQAEAVLRSNGAFSYADNEREEFATDILSPMHENAHPLIAPM